MPKQVVSTSTAPATIGPYSQAILANGFLFLSGQIPIAPETGNVPTELKHKPSKFSRIFPLSWPASAFPPHM